MRKNPRLRQAAQIIFFIPLVGLVSCDSIGTSFKRLGTRCWQEAGVCVTTKWKTTGVIHPARIEKKVEKPERAEIVVLMEFKNTCNPDPHWFRTPDPIIEKRIIENRGEVLLEERYPQYAERIKGWRAQGLDDDKMLRELESYARAFREQGFSPEDIEAHFYNKPGLHGRASIGDTVVYLSREEFDCSRVSINLREIILKDGHGVELYSKGLSRWRHLDPPGINSPWDNFPVQIKLVLPRAYVKNIKSIAPIVSAQRVWQNGMKRGGKL